MRDLTRISGWRNTRARVDRELNVPFRLYPISDIEERVFRVMRPGIEVVRVNQMVKGEENGR